METVAIIVFIYLCTIRGSHGGEGFYNIAHMTNNEQSVLWAVQKGANSVEVDLQFNADGSTHDFYHGSPCDCTCMCEAGSCSALFPNSICVQLEKTSTYPCNARGDAKRILNLIARLPKIAMVLIDSKLTDGGKKMTWRTQRTAAKNVIALLEKELFGVGFTGEVVIGAPYFASIPYIEGIAKSNTMYKDKIHFTIDQEPMFDTKKLLDFSYNKNLVYNVGISSCSPKVEADKTVSRKVVNNKGAGVFGMTYTWTVDRHDSLSYYVHYFNGIITNYPGILAKIVTDTGMKLATRSDVIPPATSSVFLSSTKNFESCECTYNPGGCKINKAAPRGFACYCEYPFLWTCAGWVVQCSDIDNSKCKYPDLGKDSCKQGRGDCGGY